MEVFCIICIFCHIDICKLAVSSTHCNYNFSHQNRNDPEKHKSVLYINKLAFLLQLLDLGMSLLYLIKFTIEYKGIPQNQLIKTWATEAEVALKAKEKGKILQIWKVGA